MSLKKPENMSPELASIWESYTNTNKEIDKQHAKQMAKIIGGGLLSIGSAFIPGTAGLKVAGALGKTIAPMVGKKIGTEIASGLVSGGLSGAVEGLGRGLIENKNPLKTMAQDSAIGLATGGLGGLAVGKIGQNIARKNLPNNPQAQKQYYNNYLEGLNNNAITKQGFNIDEIRGLKTGNYTDNGSGKLHDIIEDENGLPMKFYHATPNAGFTEFNPRSFFTKDIDYAKGYMNKNASALGIKNTADNPGVYEVNLDFNKPFDTRNPVDKNIFLNEYQAYYSPELTDRGMVDWMEVEDLADWLQEKYPQYDGIIADEGGYAGADNYGVWKGESYIPFSGNQVKIQKITTAKDQFARDLAENSQIQNAIDKINNNPNKPLQELVYRNGEQVGYGDYFNYDDDAIYIDYLRNITKDTPNYQKGVGSEIVDKILQNNPNKNIIWDTVDDNAEAFKQAYLKKHPELTPYVFQQGDYDQLVALAKDQGYNINDYLELLRGKSKKTGL